MELANKIESILETEVRPLLAIHRGNVDFVSIKNGVVELRLQGACKGCPLSELTLKEGVEAILKDKLPRDVTKVEAVA